MSIKHRQILIVILFTCLSVLTYMLGMNFDYGTITISSNVSGFSYSLNSQDYTCGQSSCTQTLRPGIYNVIASKEEFFDINTKSKIIQNQGVDLNLNFISKPKLVETSSEVTSVANTQGSSINLFNPKNNNFEPLLKLDPNKSLKNISYNPLEKIAIINYDTESYFYDLNSNKSFKLSFIDNQTPTSSNPVSSQEVFFQLEDGRVYNQVASTEPIAFDKGAGFASANHYLPVEYGYFSVMPSNSVNNNLSLKSFFSEDQDVDASDELLKNYRNQVKSLFFYSAASSQNYEITRLELTDADSISLYYGVVNSNLKPILQVGNRIYQLQL